MRAKLSDAQNAFTITKRHANTKRLIKCGFVTSYLFAEAEVLFFIANSCLERIIALIRL